MVVVCCFFSSFGLIIASLLSVVAKDGEEVDEDGEESHPSAFEVEFILRTET